METDKYPRNTATVSPIVSKNTPQFILFFIVISVGLLWGCELVVDK